MAVLYRETLNGTRYEVRNHGNTRRLYTNGVFNSQYNKTNPVTGAVWDLLSLPAFWHPQPLNRVLILGLGAGTVVHQLMRSLAPAQIDAIELNPQHIELARRYFYLDYPNVNIHCADAVAWMDQQAQGDYDLIIEDLYWEDPLEGPRRAITADREWFARLQAQLSDSGILVMNFVGRQELKQALPSIQPVAQREFKSAFSFSTPLYENRIACWLPFEAQLSQLRQRLQAFPDWDTRRRSCRLRYHGRRLTR